VGYEAIPDRLMAGELPPQAINEERQWEEAARASLVGSGLSEIICYSLTSRGRLRRLLAGMDAGDTPQVLVRADPRAEARPLAGPLPAVVDPALYSGAVEPLMVLNPLASDAEALRTTALGNMLETLRDNLRHSDRDVDLFEIARIYVPTDEKLPDERRVVSIAMGGFRSGHRMGERIATDFFDLKGPVEEMLAHLGIGDAVFVPVVHPVFHPGRAALVVLGGPKTEGDGSWPHPDQVLGILGEVRRETAEAFDISGQRAYLATLDLARLIAAANRGRQYRPLAKYPPVMQDIAVVIDEALPASAVEGRIRQVGGTLLREARLFDVYVGEPIPSGKKSLAYSLTYQSSEHTLTDEEVKAVHKRIEDALVRDLGASIRGT
jgi:phenylalanyl-tRNA synthetase beta chain